MKSLQRKSQVSFLEFKKVKEKRLNGVINFQRTHACRSEYCLLFMPPFDHEDEMLPGLSGFFSAFTGSWKNNTFKERIPL